MPQVWVDKRTEKILVIKKDALGVSKSKLVEIALINLREIPSCVKKGDKR